MEGRPRRLGSVMSLVYLQSFLGQPLACTYRKELYCKYKKTNREGREMTKQTKAETRILGCTCPDLSECQCAGEDPCGDCGSISCGCCDFCGEQLCQPCPCPTKIWKR